MEELSRLAGRDLAGLDLHRPAVDDVVFPCPTPGCDSSCTRVAPVLDAWFDSGSMPSAQHHYPFGDRAEFQKAFPADFICEAIDQTRGWFYSLLAVNTLVFGSTPYRNVVCLAHVVDEFGAKMSKSKGNVLDPWHVFDTFGADALRWYFFSAGSPWSNRRVYEDGIREATRKTLITLWNVFAFFATYADLAGWEAAADGGAGDGGAPATSEGDWDPAAADADSGHVLDRWAEARLAQTVAAVTDALDNFDALGGATTLAAFVDDLSNWYVRRSRPRFWGPAGGAADPAAFATLYRCLTVVSQLLAPFCPFLADELYVTLTGRDVGARAALARPARPRCRCRRAAGRRRRRPPAGGAGSVGPHRRRHPHPPAAAAGAGAAPGGGPFSGSAGPGGGRAQRQGHRGRGDAVRPHVVDGHPQLPGPGAPARGRG